MVSSATPQRASAYGLSTHLLLVDLVWASDIRPLLVKSFPCQTEAVYDRARVYAYGGALVQDAGYYLGGQADLSDLTHYARSGDFVSNLFRNATDVDELAFALGALTHYVGDTIGHPDATNQSVPIAFPNLGLKYHSSVVTYEKDPKAHLQVEFGFDVNAAKLGRLRPPALMKDEHPDLSLQQLAFAYYQTYGLTDDLTYARAGLSARSYYGSTEGLLPFGTYTKANVAAFKPVHGTDEAGLQKLIDDVASREDWKSHRKHAGLPRILGAPLVLFVSKTYIRYPTTETQSKYDRSVVASVDRIREVIASVHATPGDFVPLWPADKAGDRGQPLPNFNLDTGEVEEPGVYEKSGDIHRKWLSRVSDPASKENRRYAPPQKEPWSVPASAQRNLSTFFADPAKSQSDPVMTKAQLGKLGTPVTDSCPANNFGWHMVNPEQYFGDPQHSIAGLCPYITPK